MHEFNEYKDCFLKNNHKPQEENKENKSNAKDKKKK